MSKQRRLREFQQELADQAEWATPHRIILNIAYELIFERPRLWARVKPMIDAHAYESAALLCVPEGFWLSGLRREKASYVAIIDGLRMVSSERRGSEARALWEAVLLTAILADSVEFVGGVES